MGTRNVLTIAGTIVGAFFGAPQLGFMIGSLVGNAVDPIKNYGPRLSDAKVQTARDGTPIAWGAGRFRTAGTVIAVQPGGPTEHEDEDGGKGGGPVNVTYSYTYTFAVLICEGPIVGVRRIWADQKLVYDVSEEPTESYGDLSLVELLKLWKGSLAASTAFADSMTIYLGDETQMPDAELEALFGVGNVPAHRGMAYAVFKDFDVTQRGGSLPNLEFEVVKAGATIDYAGGMPTGPVGYWKLDEGSGTVAHDSSGNGFDGTYSSGAAHAGAFTANSGGSLDGSVGSVSVPFHAALSVGSAGGAGNPANWAICASVYINARSGPYSNIIANFGSYAFGYQNYFLDINGPNGNPFCGYTDMGTNGKFTTTSELLALHRAYRLWGVRTDTTCDLYCDGVLLASVARSDYVSWPGGADGVGIGMFFNGRVSDVAVFGYAPTADEIASDARYFGIGADATVPGAPGWVVDEDGNYSPTTASVTLIEPAGVSLAGFLDEIATRTDIPEDGIDTSTIPNDIDGFLVQRETNGGALITVLSQGFFFDAAEWDGKIRFVPRGGGTLLTLDADDVLATDGAPVRETIDQEIERPRKINVAYFDPALFYIPTKQTAERRAGTVAAVGETTIELPIVFSKDEAAQVADKHIKIAWTDQLGTVEFGLPSSFSYLVPTDVVNLTYRERTQRIRIEKVDEDGGRLFITGRQDRLSAYDSTATGIGDPMNPPYPAPANATAFMAMNLPALRTADNVPGVYVVACGTIGSWPGCSLEISYDGGASYQTLAPIRTASVIGELAGVATNPALSPVSEIITVDVYGNISSVTPDQIAAGANMFAIVDANDVAEVGQVQTVVAATGTGDFDLMDPLRGQLGTTAVAHVVGERFAMLANALFIPIDVAFAGTLLYFRPVTLGTAAEENAVYSLVFDPGDIVFDGGEIT